MLAKYSNKIYIINTKSLLLEKFISISGYHVIFFLLNISIKY